MKQKVFRTEKILQYKARLQINRPSSAAKAALRTTVCFFNCVKSFDPMRKESFFNESFGLLVHYFALIRKMCINEYNKF